MWVYFSSGVIGKEWTVHEQLPTISWEAAHPIAPNKRDAVKAALRADESLLPRAQDPYFYGKDVSTIDMHLAKLSQAGCDLFLLLTNLSGLSKDCCYGATSTDC